MRRAIVHVGSGAVRGSLRPCRWAAKGPSRLTLPALQAMQGPVGSKPISREHAAPSMQAPARMSSTVAHMSPKEALEAGTLGFGFSAGGLLFPYYIGVIMTLRDELGLLTADTPVAGASAGSLIAATAKSGISEADLIQATLELAHNCRTEGTRFRLRWEGLDSLLHLCTWRSPRQPSALTQRHATRSSALPTSFLSSFPRAPLHGRSVLMQTLETVLPDDIHERCSGTVHVAVTRVWPRLRPELITNFRSRKHLMESLLASCHIPWYFDGTFMTG
jgi:hypothetical protein